ncbi:hypothetical protein [Hyphomicrobium sp. 2TAF46]|uniref:hypothetical protein n=1 Tax=Hyphomicrobium sp. 2TAF46 TaxID=3233019 RepID=UPI003F92237B
MIWLAASLLAALSGLMGVGWFAPALISALVVVVVAIDSIEANEITLHQAGSLVLVVVVNFLLWRAGLALRRFFSQVR